MIDITMASDGTCVLILHRCNAFNDTGLHGGVGDILFRSCSDGSFDIEDAKILVTRIQKRLEAYHQMLGG